MPGPGRRCARRSTRRLRTRASGITWASRSTATAVTTTRSARCARPCDGDRASSPRTWRWPACCDGWDAGPKRPRSTRRRCACVRATATFTPRAGSRWERWAATRRPRPSCVAPLPRGPTTPTCSTRSASRSVARAATPRPKMCCARPSASIRPTSARARTSRWAWVARAATPRRRWRTARRSAWPIIPRCLARAPRWRGSARRRGRGRGRRAEQQPGEFLELGRWRLGPLAQQVEHGAGIVVERARGLLEDAYEPVRFLLCLGRGDGAGERAGRRQHAAVELHVGPHRRRDQVLAGGRRRDRPVDRHHRLAADVGQDRLVVLTLGVHHTHTRPAIDDLDASDRAPTVVEHQAFRRAPDSIPRDLEGARDVRGELRMLDEELEDVVARDERLALHAGGDRGLIHDGGQPRANGDGKLRGQRGPETSGERRSGNRQKGGGDERSGEVVKPRHDPPIIARPLTAARALRTFGPL